MALGRWRKRESSSRRRHRHHECVVALLAAIYCFCYTGLADASLRGNGDVGASGEVVLRTCQQAAAWTESVSNTNIIGVTGDTTKGEPLPMYFRFAFEAGETLDCLEGIWSGIDDIEGRVQSAAVKRNLLQLSSVMHQQRGSRVRVASLEEQGKGVAWSKEERMLQDDGYAPPEVFDANANSGSGSDDTPQDGGGPAGVADTPAPTEPAPAESSPASGHSTTATAQPAAVSNVAATPTDAPASDVADTPAPAEATSAPESTTTTTTAAPEPGVSDAEVAAPTDPPTSAPTSDVVDTPAPATSAATAKATTAPESSNNSTKADTAATGAPAPASAANAADATDAPVTDAPATDAPATEAPVTAAPATEAPVTDAPATDAPATDAPATSGSEALVSQSGGEGWATDSTTGGDDGDDFTEYEEEMEEYEEEYEEYEEEEEEYIEAAYGSVEEEPTFSDTSERSDGEEDPSVNDNSFILKVVGLGMVGVAILVVASVVLIRRRRTRRLRGEFQGVPHRGLEDVDSL